jgi:hypothetical protein
VLAAIDRMGVMPEPAAKPTRWMARFFLTTKRPSGGITWSVSPALMRVRRPVGEHAAFDRADADLQLAVRGQAAARAADRIAAAHVLAVDGGAQGEELAGLEGEASRSPSGMAKVIATAPAASGLTRLTVSS